MSGIKKLLEKRPEILTLKSVPSKKRRRFYYDQVISSSYNKLEEMAKEYVSLIKNLRAWEVAKHIERIFLFGKRCVREYEIRLSELDLFFHQILPKYVGGGLLGCFISGLCQEIMREDTLLLLDLSPYRSTISGMGYRHQKGFLFLKGGRLYYLGVEMEGGKIEVEGNVSGYLGRWMKGGTIIIKGSAGSWVGQGMRGGKIEITGNARDALGMRMIGGEIWVGGDVGFWLAEEMEGGCIWIKGKIKSITSDRYGGEVYQWQNNWVRI